MSRILVFCADGTCNAFGDDSSNVARVIDYLDLDHPGAQVACYDQGIGTRVEQYERIKAFGAALPHPGALHLLDPPRESWSRPWTLPMLTGSMAFGWGLETNVRQLFVKLTELYVQGDKIFLFGFSRGAFTVRALAGLTWRYGLPADAAVAEQRFDKVWPLFRDEFPDEDGQKARRAAQLRAQPGVRTCPIHFLGVWDTVKSYGGLRPVMLPHLRHNPSVAIVRHALALDERRGWFEATTWGWLDSDREKGTAMSRLEASELDAIKRQDVREVWFSGCHADVGGGGGNPKTSDIALRWMLGEAANEGLGLNATGRAFLGMPLSSEKPVPSDSHTAGWKGIESLPRRAIDNGGRWPRAVLGAAWPGASDSAGAPARQEGARSRKRDGLEPDRAA